MRCLSYCIAEKIDLIHLEAQVKTVASLQVNKHWHVLELIDNNKDSYCYIFANGTVVSWNLSQSDFEVYSEWFKTAVIKPMANLLSDEFYYQVGEETTIVPHEDLNVDCLTLESNETELKLSLSYGFSQSIKLKYYETKLDELIERYTPLTKELSSHGSIRLPYRRMQKIIGDILSVKGEINLMGDFLYQPKFFWQHPNLEVYFLMLEKYLDISRRTKTLNQQLNTLHEIFLMCSSYLETRSSHNLELIIIVLIAIEIIFSLLNLHF
ncbi:MAG: hypothetical protein A3E87_00840 [Gammaproteobacteria bacterium RIFCSPHIGHO2_12_FULL_35_23]|nr:MAG: hypothetical protein A3E87_00840 [Gammaproteobacteria bacterium RIFCSPHIGHO2_12_FULL_35_23]